MTPSKSAVRSEIEAAQLTRINQLIEAIVPGNRFYTPRLRHAGLQRGVDSLHKFSERMPFTTKAELVEDQQRFPPFGSNLTYPLSDYSRFSQTSATKGTPLRWLDTPQSWSWMTGNWERVYREAGVTHTDRLFFAFSFGPFLGFWTAFDAAAKLGCLSIPGGGMNSVARLQAIIANGISVLLCTPTYAIHLGEVAQREKIDLTQTPVRSIIVAGEPGGSIAATRRRISECWGGARVFDQHGMTEVGPVSFESVRHPGVLHVIETSYFAEVIDPRTRNPVQEGEVGELVLTPFGRDGSPLLRYRTGDLVRPVWNETEENGGTGMALEGGILGRTDDMVIIRGVNISPSAMEDVIRSIPGIDEYRVEVRSEQGMLEMRVLAELSPEVTDTGQIARDLEGRFRTAFNLRIPVEAVPYGSLPRFEMKAKRWILLSSEAAHG